MLWRLASFRGFQTTAARVSEGIASRNRARRLPSSSVPVEITKPVTLPPGRARLATTPCRTRSMAAAPMTIGIVAVARLAATAAGPPSVTMMSTGRPTSSAASAGSRSIFLPRPGTRG